MGTFQRVKQKRRMAEEQKKVAHKGQAVRLYTRATFVSYKRSMAHQNNKVALLKLEGVSTRDELSYYLGKRVAFIYRAKKLKAKRSAMNKDGEKKTNFRVIWGKIQRPHGNSGVARASFRKNLPGKALGCTMRVMLFPSRV